MPDAPPVDLRELLRRPFSEAPIFGERQPIKLSRTPLCLVGFGSVGRAAAEELVRAGAKDLTIVDPKRYSESSVGLQCVPAEVGMLKVDTAHPSLVGPAARVVTYPDDIFTVPDGVVDPASVVIVSADNTRAAIGASRLAARRKARLAKINLEPEYNIIGARCFDYRGPYPICLECQISDSQYARQTHPQSCDGTGERSTRSSRALSRAAGRIAAIAALTLLDKGLASWVAMDLQFSLASGEATWSHLSPNAACRWCHDRHWALPVRRQCGPHEITLAELLRQSCLTPLPAIQVRFCRLVALESRCEACGASDRTPHWFRQWESPIGQCADCGGPLRAVPFFARREVPLQDLTPVLDRPLAAWGVQPGAVIELADGELRRAFVIGAPRGGRLVHA